jgi:hypothetical protein
LSHRRFLALPVCRKRGHFATPGRQAPERFHGSGIPGALSITGAELV